MKFFLLIFTLVFYVFASDANIDKNSEFAHIQPVAVEEAPVVKVVEEAPLDVNINETQNKETLDIKQDADKDGVVDADDKCPNTKTGIQVDARGCELDSDGDGIVDSKDQCPGTSKEFSVDGYGCPQTATLKVNFESSKYNVSDELIDDLKNFALFLKKNPTYQVIIYGYTDSSGSNVANKKLSQNRANAVKEALSRYDIKTTRMTAIGKGEANPIADNAHEEGRAKNRRIEVELLQ
nr:OmpA family protein [uncultured Sulfurimonas sp.]